MKTLVVKCQESVDNANLRTMNELRVKCISQGTGENRVYIKPAQSDGTYPNIVEYRILSGTGALTNIGGVEQGTSYDANNFAGVVVPIGECVVQIKNFDLVTDVLGYEGTAFNSSPNASNYPKVVVNSKDLKNKTFLKQINLSNGTIECDDIADFSGMTQLTYMKAVAPVEGTYAGKLSTLSNLKNLEYLELSAYDRYANITYSLDDIIAMTSLTSFKQHGGYFEGGDVYALLKSKSSVNFEFNRMLSKTQNVTCSYVSGTSAIPEFDFTLLTLDSSSVEAGVEVVDVPTAKSILTLFKDGVAANKITVNTGAAIKIGLIGTADTELNTLKDELTSAGITVTFY